MMVADRTGGIYDSLVEYVAVSQATADPNASSHTGSASFTGTGSYEEAVEMATRTGWEELAPKISASVTGWLRNLDHAGITSYFDVAGDEVDVSLFLTGEPENMRQAIPAPAQRLSVNLVIDQSVNASCPESSIEAMATSVACALETLRRDSIACDVWAVIGGKSRKRGGKRVHFDAWKVADTASYVTPAMLAFSCGHPSILRRIMFGVVEGLPDFEANWRNGYGQSIRPDAEALPEYVTREKVAFLPKADEADWTPELVLGLIAEAAAL